MHGTWPGQVLHVDYPHVGASEPLKRAGLDKLNGVRYILVIIDDLSTFACFEPAAACTVATTAKHLLQRCKTVGVHEI